MSRRWSGETGFSTVFLYRGSTRQVRGVAPTPAVPTIPVAGMTAQWDAYQIAGQADNTALSSWADASGNGHTLTQATGANQPTYYKTTAGKTVNGLPAVWFNGSTTLMNSAAALAVGQPYTWFAVTKTTTTTGTRYVGSSNAVNVFLQQTAANWAMAAGTSVTFGTPDTNLHAVACVFNGSSSAYQLDGTLTTGQAASTDNMTGTFALGGAVGFTTNQWNGPICEFVIYPSALSAGNLTLLHTYAHTKWGAP